MISPRATLRRVLADEEARSIARRYLISNGFDGTLTSVGVIVGAVLSGIPDGATVIKIGLGAAVGLGTSAIWSVWEIERAETAAAIKRLEAAMLTDLDDTRIQRQQQGERLFHSIASGVGPLIGVIVPLLPFLFEGTALSMVEAGVAGVALGIGVLGAFGAYMGSVAGQRWYVSAARMGLAGLVVAAISIALPG